MEDTLKEAYSGWILGYFHRLTTQGSENYGEFPFMLIEHGNPWEIFDFAKHVQKEAREIGEKGGKIRDQSDYFYSVRPGELKYSDLLIIEARKGDSYEGLKQRFRDVRGVGKGIGVLLLDPHNILNTKGFDFNYMANINSSAQSA